MQLESWKPDRGAMGNIAHKAERRGKNALSFLTQRQLMAERPCGRGRNPKRKIRSRGKPQTEEEVRPHLGPRRTREHFGYGKGKRSYKKSQEKRRSKRPELTRRKEALDLSFGPGSPISM